MNLNGTALFLYEDGKEMKNKREKRGKREKEETQGIRKGFRVFRLNRA